MNRPTTALLVAIAFAAAPAFANGDIAAGKQKSMPCEACHGPEGRAEVDPQYPRIAGQYPDYIARALREYKSGERKNPIMQGFASTLSDEDIQNLAAYFSSLPSKLTDLHGHIQGN